MKTIDRSFAGPRQRANRRPVLARNVLVVAVLFAIATSASAGIVAGRPDAGIGPMPTPVRLLPAVVNAGRMHGEPSTGVVIGRPGAGPGPLPTPVVQVVPIPATIGLTTLPVGGEVVVGEATIGTIGDTLTVDQASGSVVINWDAFSIGADGTVRFLQPDGNSVALNRVLGADPSQIFGALTANGHVFLVNPNGVLFGQGASVNVGGLVASTLDIGNDDFMAGNYAFSGAGPGSVVNQGSLTAAEGGSVVLMGRTVANQGVISARLGNVALVGGEAATIDIAGDGLLSVSVDRGAVDALVENGGLIQADGGHVLLTAQAAGGLFDTVVNNTGVIQARTIENRGGTIVLLGDKHAGRAGIDEGRALGRQQHHRLLHVRGLRGAGRAGGEGRRADREEEVLHRPVRLHLARARHRGEHDRPALHEMRRR